MAKEQNHEDKLVFYEWKLSDIVFPFEKREVLPDLRNTFRGYTVTKEIGQQDGPDFPLYSVSDQEEELLFFAMDSDDTLKLAEVNIKTPLIADQYGLRVGDDYQKIKMLRHGKARVTTNLHQHTFIYFDSSNIGYEISGDILSSDTTDFNNLRLTEAQITNWVIKRIIWRKN